MIESYGTLYAGHVDFEEVGFDAPALNDRWLTEDKLNSVYNKAESIAKVLDDNGFDIFWMAEHHFQREGYECLPNIMMLAVHLAHLTKNIRIGCGFNVAPMWHPLRMAEDFATADILTKNRVVFGVARGYHTREVEVFGNPMTDADANRELFEEQVEVVQKAFNQDSFSHKGKNYTIPPAVDYRGYELEEITLVPRPMKRPVDCWQPIVSASERGLKFMAKHKMKGIVGGGAKKGGSSEKVIEAWRRIQVENGVEAELGENLCVSFNFHIAETEEKAIKEVGLFFEENMKMFAPLGFIGGLDEGQIEAINKGGVAARSANLPTMEDAVNAGGWLVGTPESVAEKLDEIQSRYPFLKYINVGQAIGTPQKVIVEQLEVFGKEVIPRVSPDL